MWIYLKEGLKYVWICQTLCISKSKLCIWNQGKCVFASRACLKKGLNTTTNRIFNKAWNPQWNQHFEAKYKIRLNCKMLIPLLAFHEIRVCREIGQFVIWNARSGFPTVPMLPERREEDESEEKQQELVSLLYETSALASKQVFFLKAASSQSHK